MATTKRIPTALQKRIDNVKSRYGITIIEDDAIMSYLSDEGGSSVGYRLGATTKKASLTIGDTAIDYGMWLLDRTIAQRRKS